MPCCHPEFEAGLAAGSIWSEPSRLGHPEAANAGNNDLPLHDFFLSEAIAWPPLAEARIWSCEIRD